METVAEAAVIAGQMNVMRSRSISLLGCALAATLVVGTACTSSELAHSQDASAAQRAAADEVSYWDGNGKSGQPSIKIHLGEQRAYFYEGKALAGVSELSTGREGHHTPAGSFKVIERDRTHRSSEYGDYVNLATQQVTKRNVQNGEASRPPESVFVGASMPNFLRITGGIGLHAGYLPGVPASHGCSRMPAFMAENFFENAPLGTPVSISP